MVSISLVRKFGIYVVLLLLVAIFSVLSPVFLSGSNLINVARQISMLSIVAIGVTFVMISGGMDLSVGSQMGFIGIVTAIMMVRLGLSPLLAIPFSMLAGIAIGMINGTIAVKLKVHPLIVTLGTMTILRGLAYIACDGYPIFGFPPGFSAIGQGYVGILPIPVIIMAVVIAIGSFVLNRTYIGRYVFALGGNEEAARLAGIDTDKMKIIVYSICGFFCGLASVIMLSRVNSGQPGAGGGYEFDVMTAAVLGGVSFKGGEGKISGVIVGVLIMGILSNGMVLLNINDYYQNVLKGVVLLIAVGLESSEDNSGAKGRKDSKTPRQPANA